MSTILDKLLRVFFLIYAIFCFIIAGWLFIDKLPAFTGWSTILIFLLGTYNIVFGIGTICFIIEDIKEKKKNVIKGKKWKI